MSGSSWMLLSRASWVDVQSSAADLADTGGKTVAIRKHATMATVLRDGAPRISGTEVDFAADGEIYLGMMPGARRAADLRCDPRVATHCIGSGSTSNESCSPGWQRTPDQHGRATGGVEVVRRS